MTEIMLEQIKALAAENGCELTENVMLSDYTSFRTGGLCPLIATPKTVEGLCALTKALEDIGARYTVLGNGSNMLALDEGFDGVIIRVADGLTDLYLVGEDEIFCGAGVKLIRLCNFALENSLSGLEFAYGIPGSCGGAVYMNAGAYGGEIKDVLVRAEHIEKKTGAVGSFLLEEADMSYRHSIYCCDQFIITGALFKLKKADSAQIRATMNELIGRRRAKQPLEYPSAGSTFKRPTGLFAGALIEECALKGFSIGGAQVSEKHAGFVINKGGATSADVLSLIEHIQATVFAQKGVSLEPEVKILR